MDKPLLAYSLWLSLTDETKKRLVKLYSIPRTGEVVVHVGEMMNGNIGASAKQDGHKPEDLYAITQERTYELLNEEMPEEPNFYAAFDAVLANLTEIYTEQYPDEMVSTEPVIHAVPEIAPQPVPEEEFVPRDPEELLKKPEGMPEPIEESPLPEEPKVNKDAKTTKAKGSKAK